MKRAVALVTLLVVAVTAVGCGSIKTDEGSISLKNGQVELKGNDGSTVTVGEEGTVQAKSGDGTQVIQTGPALPEGYPSDVLPVMKGGTIVSSLREGEGYGVTFETKATAQEVTQYYDSLLKGKPEYQFMDMSSMTPAPDDVSTLVRAGKDNFWIGATINSDNERGVTLVELFISPKDAPGND